MQVSTDKTELAKTRESLDKLQNHHNRVLDHNQDLVDEKVKLIQKVNELNTTVSILERENEALVKDFDCISKAAADQDNTIKILQAELERRSGAVQTTSGQEDRLTALHLENCNLKKQLAEHSFHVREIKKHIAYMEDMSS